MYQYINLKEHIPKHIHHVDRYLRICYDDKPKGNPTTNTNINNPKDTPDPPELPRNTKYIQQETPTWLPQQEHLLDVTPPSPSPSPSPDMTEQDTDATQPQQETKQQETKLLVIVATRIFDYS